MKNTKMEEIKKVNVETKKITLSEKQKSNIKKWSKRLEYSESIKILFDSFIPYFQTTGKNFYGYNEKGKHQEDLKKYKELEKNFFNEDKRMRDLLTEYCKGEMNETKFEVNFFKYYKLQVEIMEIAREWQPKIVKYCKSTKAGW